MVKKEQVLALYNQGLARKEIALHLKITVNVVAGILYRAKVKSQHIPSKINLLLPLNYYAAPKVNGSKEGYSLVELPLKGCKFAITDHGMPRHEHRFCGKPAILNKSWCEQHYNKVYQR